MKFLDIRSELSVRILDCKVTFELIKRLESENDRNTVANSGSRSLKGQIFVLMYGAWEYTVHGCLKRVMMHICNDNLSFNSVEKSLLSIFLHSDMDSIVSSNSKKWEKRVNIFNKANSKESIPLVGYVDVTSGANIKARQLEIIQYCYNIPDPILPDSRLRGRLDELVENRNAIAHGRESSGTIGGRYSILEIEERLEDLNQLCIYFISKMEEYLINRCFVKSEF